MQQSIELCSRFAQEIGVNVWFRQGGYLFLAKHERERPIMERNVELQNRCGVPTRMMTPEEAGALVPELDIKKIVCACYNPKDGVLFPWPFLWGYAHQALKRGVEVHLFTNVSAIERDPGGGFALTTTKGRVRAQRVINAAGAWSPEVARLLGVELPNHPHRHEILSTEPLKPFLKPMVSVLSSGLYFSQSMRGEIVTGITVEDDATGIQLGSRLKFLTTLAKEMVALVPRFADLKVLRQWAGPYDVSPDGHPILGEPPGVPGFFLACGFVGHGFMMAPIIAKLYAEWLAGGTKHEVFERCRLSRFAEGKMEKESMILG
jgi:sarcosine oxidase subunit beta